MHKQEIVGDRLATRLEMSLQYAVLHTYAIIYVGAADIKLGQCRVEHNHCSRLVCGQAPFWHGTADGALAAATLWRAIFCSLKL